MAFRATAARIGAEPAAGAGPSAAPAASLSRTDLRGSRSMLSQSNPMPRLPAWPKPTPISSGFSPDTDHVRFHSGGDGEDSKREARSRS